jgi:predicted O-methyltransferase YrrM
VRHLTGYVERNVRRRRGVRRLERRTDPASHALARAFRVAFAGAHDAAAVDWFRRIEERRHALLRSDDVVEVRLGEYIDHPEGEHVDRRAVAEVCRNDSKPPHWGRLLFSIVRELRPRSALELGAGVGLSAAYQAAALELVGDGRLLTLEAAEQRVALSRETLRELGLGVRAEVRHGRFAEALEPALAELAPIDYAFIDGHHEEEATLRYWGAISPNLARPAVVLFDDIRWSPGMIRAWGTLCHDPQIDLAADLGTAGACLVGVGDAATPLRVPVD